MPTSPEKVGELEEETLELDELDELDETTLLAALVVEELDIDEAWLELEELLAGLLIDEPVDDVADDVDEEPAPGLLLI